MKLEVHVALNVLQHTTWIVGKKMAVVLNTDALQGQRSKNVR